MKENKTYNNVHEVFKGHELTIDISAQRRRPIVTNTQFFSMDVSTGKKIIHFTMDGIPFNLTDKKVVLGFEFVEEKKTRIIESTSEEIAFENARLGRISVHLPNHIYQYSGEVLIHAYIIFEDGRSLDAGVIATEFKESWLDSELEEMTDFYVNRFEDLWQVLQARVDELKTEIKAQLNQVKSDADRIASQLADYDIPGHINDQDVHLSQAERDVLFGATSSHQIEGSATVENTREGKLGDKNLEGRTMVNLWSDDRADFMSLNSRFILDSNVVSLTTAGTNFTGSRDHHFDIASMLFKPSTDYTFVIDIDQFGNVISGSDNIEMLEWFFDWDSNTRLFSTASPRMFSFRTGNQLIMDRELGRHILVLRTRADISSASRLRQLIRERENSVKIVNLRMSIFEGDWSHRADQIQHTPPRQLTSVGDGVDELGITTVGENLFDGLIERGNISVTTGQLSVGTTEVRGTNPIPVIGGREVFFWRNTSGSNHIIEYDQSGRFIKATNPGSTGIRLDQMTKAIRWRTGASAETDVDQRLNSRVTITYDRRVTNELPHQPTSTTIEYQDTDGTWKKPVLQSINNGADVLVADEITETEYIQRVVEITDIRITGINTSLANVTRAVVRSNDFAQPQGTISVICNKVPTASTSNMLVPGVAFELHGENTNNLIVAIPRNNSITTQAQMRQYLIDNNYQFLVPLATPRRFPIRMQSLSSFEPLTNIKINSGTVKPRFNFKIIQNLPKRLALAEEKIRALQQVVMGLINREQEGDEN